jgi:predicted amidohydrolase
MSRLRVGLAQFNATVGAIDANIGRMLERMAEAEARGVDVLAFPELAVCGVRHLRKRTGVPSKR